MPEASGVRAFLAVPADPAWSEAVESLAVTLRNTCPPASWTRASARHLTVKFLGPAAPDALDAFARAIEPVAAALPPGELSSAAPLVFPAAGPPRVLAIGFAPSPALDALRALASAAEGEARRLGLEREERPFHPHATVARLKSRWPRESVAQFEEAVRAAPMPSFPVRRCVLYASRLERSGAVHTPLREWAFSGAAAAVGIPA